MTSHPSSESTNTIELALTGMHCGSCVALIEEVLADQPGVTSAAVDLDAAAARVTFDGAAVSVDGLCAAVVGVGYGATLREATASS